jgi:hypothetical protein
MALPAQPTDRADQVFRIGPEDLVARSSSVVAGSISDYSKEVQRYSGTGPNAIALEWVARGRIDGPTVFKGAPPPAPISFSRQERSALSPGPSAVPIWELAFGELKPSGQAILFIDSGGGLEALPNGTGDQDLIALVKDIVRIQGIRDAGLQRRSWLQYLITAPTSEGRRVALRSLAHGGVDWRQMAPALTQFWSEPATSPDLRAFAFGFVAFQLTSQAWSDAPGEPGNFLCRVFSAEKETEQQLRYLQNIKLLLSYTVEEPRQDSRRPVQQSILGCLATWASRGLTDRDLQQEYNQIIQRYR